MAKKINVKPLHDRVLVKRVEEKGEQKVGGIIIPDSAKEKPLQADVVAVDDGSADLTPALLHRCLLYTSPSPRD